MAAGVPARVPVKIAVRLPNWLGDTVMAVPAIRSLRDTFPDAQVLLAGIGADGVESDSPVTGGAGSSPTRRLSRRRDSIRSTNICN
jgi:hypothetical protein